ncbi:MAG: hypothetical protein VCB59_12845 [Gammaproteobacteria bacterium]
MLVTRHSPITTLSTKNGGQASCADDQAGGMNYITVEKRVAAASLVRKGEVPTLGMPYHSRMPIFPGRI